MKSLHTLTHSQIMHTMVSISRFRTNYIHPYAPKLGSSAPGAGCPAHIHPQSITLMELERLHPAAFLISNEASPLTYQNTDSRLLKHHLNFHCVQRFPRVYFAIEGGETKTQDARLREREWYA